MKKSLVYLIAVGAILILVLVNFFIVHKNDTVPEDSSNKVSLSDTATERFRARVDRVEVQFEHWDYTRYRLQTNDLIREGEMNSERGFRNDLAATVYVLNWQKPVGEQIRYVRLSAEPNFLYILDTDNLIIQGSRLILE